MILFPVLLSKQVGGNLRKKEREIILYAASIWEEIGKDRNGEMAASGRCTRVFNIDPLVR